MDEPMGLTNQVSPIDHPRRPWRRVHLMGLVAVGLLVQTRPSEASPIRGHRLLVVSGEGSLGPAWSRFLSRGPAFWAHARPPRFPSYLVLPQNANGTLVDTPFVDYLTWRRALNPWRFDHYHPIVGPELARSLPPPPPPTLPIIPTMRPTIVPRPKPLEPQSLPEPATLTIALILTGAAFLHGRRGRRFASRRAIWDNRAGEDSAAVRPG